MGVDELRRVPPGAIREILNLDLPGVPPSVNHMYAPGRGGRKYLTEAARSFREMVIFSTRPRYLANPDVLLDLRDCLSLRVGVWFPDEKRRDLDNVLKSLQDALALSLGFRDENVWELYAVRLGVDRKDPRVEVHLWEIAPDGGT